MALLSRNRAPVASLGSRRCRAGVMLGQNGDHDSRIRPSIVVPVGISPSPWFASGSLICTIATAIASGRPAHRPFRGLLGVHSRCGLHTRAVTKFATAIRGLQTFRHLHACLGCFRLERSPGGPCTHWKSAALSRRTWKPDLRATGPADWLGSSTSPFPALAFTSLTYSIIHGKLSSTHLLGGFGRCNEADILWPS